ncbi:sec-independent protein translocase protein TatA [Nocardioides exalbidus]|uniref:Sec-independent protein translocase protein TatA n=1 Tax=Nocardioides exalbidus TaxID=402596 RepID=A0A1H4W9E5_9ACTN|nr:twin-arginine translocase TatA/TatE family subunit [Nocardioides exalbidus]SEC90009.1 sec-independent protein translocase protein TatA [Nocardioides exalbidus]
MTSTITPLLIGGLGGMELLIILAVLVLLFGASKLPELARGSGQALKIFKAETKGLIDSDDKHDDKHRAATTVEPTTQAVSDPIVSEPIVSEPVVVETPRQHDAPRA